MTKGITFCALFMKRLARFANTRNQTRRTSRPAKPLVAKSLLCRLLTAAVLASSSSQAALIAYDGFVYTPTGPLTIDGQPNNGTQASNGWDNVTWGQGLGGATGYVVTNGSLADPTATLFTGSNSVFTTGGFAGRYNTPPPNWATPGIPMYFSILIRPANTPATNHYYGLQLFSNGGNTGDGHDLFIGKNGSGLNWGLQYSSNDVTGASNVFVNAFSGVAAAANQTVLLVVRIDFNFGSPDVFSLYVNPTPGGTEPAVASAIITNDIGTQNGVGLNSGNGGQAFFDEVRLGGTFASVTPTTSAVDPNLFTYEAFAYNQGVVTTTLDSQPNNGTQASNGWSNVTWGQFLGGATSYTIGHGSLSDPSNLLMTTGNCAQTQGGFAGRYNNFPSYGANGSTAYFSILIRPDSAPTTTNFYGLQLFNNTGQGDLFVGKNGSGLNWGLQHGTTNAFSSIACVSNQTVLLVLRGDYTSGSDTFRLYVNPTPGAPEPGTADATVTYDIGTQNGLGLNAGNLGAATFDELRIGTNYADVTPAVTVVANPFVITSIQLLGRTNAVISFTTTTTNIYSVEANSDLVTGTWTTVSSGIPGTGGIVQSTNAIPPGTLMKFFRARHP